MFVRRRRPSRPLSRLVVPLILFAAALVSPACTGAPEGGSGATGPASGSFPYLTAAPTTWMDSVEGVRQVARFVAHALADSGFRIRLYEALRGSRVREQKLQMQRYFRRRGAGLARRIEMANGLPDGSFDLALDRLPALELYLPVPADRQRWRGAADILVTGFIESDAELRSSGDQVPAWDSQGSMRMIPYDAASDRPVLVVTAAESRFAEDGESPESGSAPLSAAPCTGKKCPPPPPPPPDPCAITAGATNLYVCHVNIPDVGSYEGALRGSPEVSMQMFSILPNGSGLAQIGCINEDQTGLRFYDQEQDLWDGRALIASQDAINTALAAGRKVVMQVWEDDNGSKCSFSTTNDEVRKIYTRLGLAGALISFGWQSCHMIDSCDPVPWPVFLVGASVAAITTWLLGNDDDLIGVVAVPAGGTSSIARVPILAMDSPDAVPRRTGIVYFTVQP